MCFRYFDLLGVFLEKMLEGKVYLWGINVYRVFKRYCIDGCGLFFGLLIGS